MNLNKNLLLSIILGVLTLCLGAWFFFINSEKKSSQQYRTWSLDLISDQTEKVVPSEPVTISNNYIKEALVQQGIAFSGDEFNAEDLWKVTELVISFQKHYIKELDLSELSQLKNLKKLTIYWRYQSGEAIYWERYVSLKGIGELPQLETFHMHDFPLEALDLSELPGSLQDLMLARMGMKSLINREDLQNIPNVNIYVDVQGEARTYSYLQGRYSQN